MLIQDCLTRLADSQESDKDNRERSAEADAFVNVRGGQWEPHIYSSMSGRPRYTFDECSPVVDDVVAYIGQKDFDISVAPTGISGSKDTADIFEGLIRTIQKSSRSRMIIDDNIKTYVLCGLAAFEVRQAYVDGKSFDQELVLRSVHNAKDNLWFDTNAKKQDMSDAEHAWKMIALSKAKYEKVFPKGSGISVGDNKCIEYYYTKPEQVVVGEYYYVKKRTIELAQLSNGQVVEVNDEFNMIIDELRQQGITIAGLRDRKVNVVYQRLFDGDDWLTEEQETVFSFVPLIPIYGNYTVTSNKIVYNGVIEKLMDAQRVINYAESRNIEEGALSPKDKIWLTKDQAKSADVRQGLRTLNTNNDPVQFYDHVGGQPPPGRLGPQQANANLITTSETAKGYIERSSRVYDSARGDAPAGRSGEAIELLQTRADSPKEKWVRPVEIALEHTCRILVDAIPKVYDTRREVLLTQQDGTTRTVTLKDRVLDQDTGRLVELYDLNKGRYLTTCKAGHSYSTRRQHTVSAITEAAAVDPSVIELGGDVLLNNIDAPGVDQIAERKRLMMLNQGLIPESQMTDEEKTLLQRIQEAKQGQELSPIDQANLMIAQAQLQETQGRNEERALKLRLEEQKLKQKEFELSLKAQKAQVDASMEATRNIVDLIKKQAETLKVIKEAIGADTVVTPIAVKAYDEQAKDLLRSVVKT